MAGRIPQRFIDDLLERLDIVEVVDRRVPLKKAGKNYSARCPFHDEKTPSFTVSPDKQFYYCFGCGAGGNAIGFVMDFERLDFPQAVENLAHGLGLEVPREDDGRGRARAEAPQRRDLYELMEQVARYYREQLRTHPGAGRAVDYLKGRGLSGTIARDFELGFAPPGWDHLLRQFGEDEAQRQRLVETGMLIEREGGGLYDRFRDRIMFPIRDNRGRVVAFGGRVLGDDKPKYLNSPETGIFNKGRELYGLYQARRAQRQLRRLLLVEGYMDVVALAQFGIPYAAATLGTATSLDHLRKVFRHCPEVVICFDGDDAGRQAARRALETLLPVMEDGRQARFLFMPEGEDPDTLVRTLGREGFEQRVATALPLEEYLFQAAGEDLDLNTLEARARLAHRAAPLIGLLPEGVFRQLILRALAERTGLAQEELVPLLRTAPRHSRQGQGSAGERHPGEGYPGPGASDPGRGAGDPGYGSPSPREYEFAAPGPRRRPVLPERSRDQRDPVLYALGLLVLHPSLARQLGPESGFEHLDGQAAELLRAVLELLARRPESSTHMLLAQWYEEPWRDWLVKAIRCAYFVTEESAATEFLDTARYLRKTAVNRDLSSMVDKLRGRNYAELSPQEKQQLRQLLAQKHSE